MNDSLSVFASLQIVTRERLFQVALSVAAEFWEQGDLERTVLEQQPIVSPSFTVGNICMIPTALKCVYMLAFLVLFPAKYIFIR